MTASAGLQDAPIPFSGATGRGLKIAVIDSGVNRGHPHICAPTKGIVVGNDTDQPADDVLGHGTAVMAAIQEKAPEGEYYAVKLFGNSLRTSSSRLMEAIDWTIRNGMDIVNLSLGTPNLDYRAGMQELVERARQAGTILVAARPAGSQPVLPGVLDGVIAVDVDWEIPRQVYRVAYGSDSRCFFASGFPRPLPGMPPARNLNGISFAVANLTGIVARCCEGMAHRSFEDVEERLVGGNRS